MPESNAQQHVYYPGANELLIERIYASVKDQLVQKRWEFQHTDIDPNRLWNIANQVETLNWVSKKLIGILRQYKPVTDSSVKSLVTLLRGVLIRTDKHLLKFDANRKKSYEFYRMKSRAMIIEWTLFQIHFISGELGTKAQTMKYNLR
jgi:hypothetical protein